MGDHEGLKGKPKVLCLDACRLELELQAQGSRQEAAKLLQNKPLQGADFMIGFACSEGHESYADPSKGGIYSHAIKEILRDFMAEDGEANIEDVLTAAQTRIQESTSGRALASHHGTHRGKFILKLGEGGHLGKKKAMQTEGGFPAVTGSPVADEAHAATGQYAPKSAVGTRCRTSSAEEVQDFLKSCGLESFCTTFFENEVDSMKVLQSLEKDDLTSMGLKIGQIKKFEQGLQEALERQRQAIANASAEEAEENRKALERQRQAVANALMNRRDWTPHRLAEEAAASSYISGGAASLALLR